jgi:hypothetical protein
LLRIRLKPTAAQDNHGGAELIIVVRTSDAHALYLPVTSE